MSEPRSAGRPRAAMLRKTPGRPAGFAWSFRTSGSRGPRRGSQRSSDLRELLPSERLAQEIIHAGGQTALAISFERIGGQRDDGHPWAARASSRRRISSVAVRPSMTGIWRSMSTASKLLSVTASTANRPYRAASVRQPRLSSMPIATSRFTALSSTRRILGTQATVTPEPKRALPHRSAQARRLLMA